MQNHDDNNNYMSNADLTANNVAGFYKDKKIFITGATGFVGKTLIEKLLRSCGQLDAIYILIRPKRGMTIEQRLEELVRTPLFIRIREKNPEAFQKIKLVAGDVSLPNLGLNEGDRRFLEENVEVVFHSAATVRFNENLKNAVLLNTLGTKRVLELCEKMQNLKSFVHVSTAYSNCDRRTIQEQVYKPQFDPNAVICSMDVLPQEAIHLLSKRLLGKHPNTYTYTKALAEHLVSQSSSAIPAAIVRPSVITSAWKEPFPGWVDNLRGTTGIFTELGRGTIKTMICDEKCTFDQIPVDVVVNTIITAAWHTVAYRSNTIRVYNCTSGTTNPISFKEFRRLTHKHWYQYPSKYVTWYPGFTYRTNRLMHVVYVYLFHLIPSAILDVFLYCTRQKPIMLKRSRKFYAALDDAKFFCTKSWDFKISTWESLMGAVRSAEDGDNFRMDISASSGFDWDLYFQDYSLGVRQWVLKDDLSSLSRAKAKLNRLYWFQKIYQALTMYTLFKIAMR